MFSLFVSFLNPDCKEEDVLATRYWECDRVSTAPLHSLQVWCNGAWEPAGGHLTILAPFLLLLARLRRA